MEASIPKQSKSKVQDNFTKGGLFEWYVVRLFNQQHFKQLKWRRAKKFNSPQDLVDYGFPDLEWELVFSGANRYRFAVECKWRERFWDGKLEWAKEHEIERYQEFQRTRNMTVFVVIGVGGQPGSPEKLYVTPLDEIAESGVVGMEQLREYKREVKWRFYYSWRQGRLW